MMRKSTLFIVLTILLAFTSCATKVERDHRFDKLNEWETEFAKDFDDNYGYPDSEHSCMTVTVDTVTVDMSALPSGKYKVQFYTDDPREASAPAYLLAEYQDVPGAKTTTLNFDYPTGKSTTYCAVISADGQQCWVSPITMQNPGNDRVAIDKDKSESLFASREPMHYFLAFEGKTPEGVDYDYNDVILDLAYVQGQSSAVVTLKAVGCSCHTIVKYRPEGAKSTKNSFDLFDEAHAALGYPATYSYAEKRNVYYILNTGINDSGKTAETILDLTQSVGQSVTKIAPNFVATFTTNDEDPKTATDTYIPADRGSICPFAIMLAVPNWNWLPEGMMVHVAYSRFPYWTAYPKDYPLWYTKVWN